MQLLKALVADSLVLLDCLEKNGLQAFFLLILTYILDKYFVLIIFLYYSDDKEEMVTVDFKNPHVKMLEICFL